MSTEDLLRLAWEAEHDGRRSLRDGVMTLAVAESRPEDAWADRCRARLVSERPGHFLGEFATLRQALEDPRVIASRDRLRLKFPPARVRSMLLRANAARGTYTGRVESLDAMIDDLAGPSAEAENVRRDAAQPARGPMVRSRAARPVLHSIADPSMSSWDDGPADDPPSGDRWIADRATDEGSTNHQALVYLTVLLAIAMLLASVRDPSASSRPDR